MKLNLKTILILVVLLSFSFATSQNDYGKVMMMQGLF